jgi:hypothetical protein
LYCRKHRLVQKSTTRWCDVAVNLGCGGVILNVKLMWGHRPTRCSSGAAGQRYGSDVGRGAIDVYYVAFCRDNQRRCSIRRSSSCHRNRSGGGGC